LRRLDEGWWLSAMPKSVGKLCIDVDFAVDDEL
jgi:hypothetical protein